MVRYTGDTKVTNNNFVELSEECQLAVNGGCNSNSGSDLTIMDYIREFVRGIAGADPGSFPGYPY